MSEVEAPALQQKDLPFGQCWELVPISPQKMLKTLLDSHRSHQPVEPPPVVSSF